MFSGRKYQVGVGKESSRGTAVTPTYWVPKYEVSVDNKKEYIHDEASIGIVVDSTGARIVREWSEGEISGILEDKSFGLFLYGAFGSVSSAVKETTAYNHTFSIANSNAHQSLTLEIKNDLEQLKYALGVIESLKITAETGKFVEFSAAFKAKKGATAANSPSYTTQNKFTAKNVTFKHATNLAGLSGASAINIKSFELSISKNIEDHTPLGTTEPVDYANKFVTVEGTIEALFENLADFKAVFEAGTIKAIQFDIVDTGVTIGATSNPELKIQLPTVSFEDWSRKSANNDIASQTIKFKGHYSATDSSLISAVLTNTATLY